jgi:hypothetical protein
MLAKKVNGSTIHLLLGGCSSAYQWRGYTTHLLLGDSVLQRTNGEVMFQRSIKYQNLSVSGLSGEDLLAWLSQTSGYHGEGMHYRTVDFVPTKIFFQRKR